MSLRTVAGETPRPCRSTSALEPTGPSGATESSAIARRTASLRSSCIVSPPHQRVGTRMSGVPSVLGRATARAPEHPYSDPVSFAEVADRVWVARYDQFDVNVPLVAGDRGLLVVDTHASAAAARGVV